MGGKVTDILISNYSVLPAMAFCAAFFLLKKMSLSHMPIHLSHNLMSDLNSDGL